MVEIESPLGRTRANIPTRRVLTVDDETADSLEQAPEATSSEVYMRQQLDKRAPLDDIKKRQELVKAQNRIASNSKNRLEILLGIGRATKEVTVDDFKFSLQTLKDHEIEQLAILPKLYNEKPGDFKESTALEFLFHLRRVTLAYSLFAIDGLSVDEVLGTSDFNEKVEALSQFDNNLTSYLFNKYEELRDETSAKYSIKNKKDVEEVVEDVKK